MGNPNRAKNVPFDTICRELTTDDSLKQNKAELDNIQSGAWGKATKAYLNWLRPDFMSIDVTTRTCKDKLMEWTTLYGRSITAIKQCKDFKPAKESLLNQRYTLPTERESVHVSCFFKRSAAPNVKQATQQAAAFKMNAQKLGETIEASCHSLMKNPGQHEELTKLLDIVDKIIALQNNIRYLTELGQANSYANEAVTASLSALLHELKKQPFTGYGSIERHAVLKKLRPYIATALFIIGLVIPLLALVFWPYASKLSNPTPAMRVYDDLILFLDNTFNQNEQPSKADEDIFTDTGESQEKGDDKRPPLTR